MRLGSLDSNQDLKSQSLPGCHYPTPQGEHILARDGRRAGLTQYRVATRRLTTRAKMPRLRGVSRTGGGTLTAVVALIACVTSLTCAPGAPGAPAPGSSAPPVCAGANVSPSGADAQLMDTATLCLLNGARAAYRLQALRANDALSRAASAKLAGMLSENYFADVSPSGSTPLSLIAATHYARAAIVGQDIAWGTGAATPERVVSAWMASPEHRAIILDGEYRDVGVAVTAAVPALLNTHGRGATYVIELGARL